MNTIEAAIVIDRYRTMYKVEKLRKEEETKKRAAELYLARMHEIKELVALCFPEDLVEALSIDYSTLIMFDSVMWHSEDMYYILRLVAEMSIISWELYAFPTRIEASELFDYDLHEYKKGNPHVYIDFMREDDQKEKKGVDLVSSMDILRLKAIAKERK